MSKATVLIVEDEAIVAADLAGKLTQFGYAVIGMAVGGEEAVELARRLRPHLVLMDISLEGAMDGIEAAEAIRRQRDVPVVYLTAHADPATLSRVKLTGPFGYILKPFEERELAIQLELALYKHQTDQQLRQQREWLQVTLNSIGDGVIATDALGQVTFVNLVAESLTGWTAEEAQGQPIGRVLRLIDEQTGQPLEERVTRVLQAGSAATLTNHTALRTKDGRTIPIEDSAAPIRDASGQVIGVVLVFHDVTEKRRAEEALRRTKDEWEETFNTVPDSVAILDLQHRIVRANQAMAKRLNRTAEQCVGLPCYEVVHGTSSPHQACPHVQTCGDTREHTLELEEPHLGRSYLVTTSPRFDAGGRVIGTIHVARDITRLKQTEKALQQLNEHLERRVAEQTTELRAKERSLVEAQRIAHLGNWEWNLVTDQLTWSDEVYRIVGLTRQQFGGNHVAFLEWVHPADRARVQQAVHAALADPNVRYRVEHRMIRPDGIQRVVAQRGEVTFDPAGTPLRMIGTVHDISEQRRAEEETLRMKDELAHVDRTARMGELAGSLAHEINQPLTAILCNAQAARRFAALPTPDLDLLREILDDIIRDDKRAGSVIHRLRTMLQKGKPELETLHINDVIGEVVQLLHGAIIERNVSLGLDLLPQLPPVKAGHVEVQQVLVNLLLNALDALPHAPSEYREIVIRTRRHQQDVVVAVRDRGCGIQSPEVNNIFEPFFTTKSAGLGMGLAICRRIILAHGGRIWAENNQDVGATVSFSLPSVQTPEEPLDE